jgi:alanine-synthesizing transaminase
VRRIRQSQKLQHVRYDVRGPILVEAQRLEAEGHRILKLNIGNPAPFGFEAPDAIVADMVRHLPEAQGYSDSRGIYPARTAVAHYYQERGLRDVGVDDVFIGNGVSELISMVLQAFVDDGNEILVPAPDYPLWTGAVTLSGGTPVHYRCHEAAGWEPDLADLESKITEHTHAVVVINPNNPTGAVYSEDTVRGLVDIARRHDLVVMADEIYEKILYDGAVHHHAATYAADDVLCLTFSGLSKAYRVCGYRAGWVMISGPTELATDFLEGLTLVANMRMCANVPAQHAIQTALGGYQSVDDLVAPGGRFHEQTMLADRLLNQIPGVSSVRPRGALYCFPRLDPQVYGMDDDEAFVIDLLRAKHLLQLVRAGPLPAGHPARRRGPDRRDRPDRRLPGHPALSCGRLPRIPVNKETCRFVDMSTHRSVVRSAGPYGCAGP